jgi:predicted O-methyltransferase YrrM
MPRDITPNIDYIRKLYAPQDALLQSIDQTLRKMDMGINIGADEGKLLQLIIMLYNVKTIVEIGTLAGYSTIWMARAVPPQGHVYTVEKSPEHAAMARHFFDQATDIPGRITLLEGDAAKTLSSLNDKGPFDMVFIDADKPGYNDYLDWAEKNVRQYGLIVADNTLLFGTMGLEKAPDNVAPSTWQAMRHFNERLADKEKYFSTMIPTQEGLSVAVKLF